MRRSALLFTALSLAPAPAAAGGNDVCVLRRASLDAAGAQTVDHSRKPSISTDGEWIAFESDDSTLVPGDTNAATDVFVKHVPSGAIERVSVLPGGPNGGQADGPSRHASISADGRFVVFESEATNLWIGDSNGVRDVFVHDRAAFLTRLVSIAITGTSANGASGAGGLWRGSAISGDGTLVSFQSTATNLVAGDTNNTSDVFVHVLATGATTRVSYRPTPNGPIQSNGSSQDPALSHDGRFVAFSSAASNLVPGDGNSTRDIFVFDRLLVAIQRASLPVVGNEAHGECYQPSLSADGTRVAFESFATDLVPADTNGVIDVFLRDLAAATTQRASLGWMGQEANNYAYRCSLSGDGTRVAFTSAASNLVPGGNGIQTVYVRDLVVNTTERWGEDANGSTGFAGSDEASFTTDGRTMAFTSLAALVADDTNAKIDIYHRRCGPTGTPYCAGTAVGCPCMNGGVGQAGCENSYATGGGLLLAQGMPRVSLDTVTLLATGLPPTAPILFFQGDAAVGGGFGLPFGDGLRCAGGSVVRLGTRAASAGAAAFGQGVGSDPAVSIAGGVPAAGASLRYQGWYRDTQAFCTPHGFNLTNGLRLDWAP